MMKRFFAVRITLIVRASSKQVILKSLGAGAHDTPTLVGVGVPSWKQLKRSPVQSLRLVTLTHRTCDTERWYKT